jgi:flagellar basal-body rod modification protein FlgD
MRTNCGRIVYRIGFVNHPGDVGRNERREITMSVSAINNTAPSTNQIPNANFQLKAEDFIQMMVTQLQNQDPLEPAKNEELLAQMSQIGQLQSTTQLQSSLTSMVLQNNIGAAGNLIGKTVKGIDEQSNDVQGLVTSVKVEKNDVFLELDNGNSLSMSKVETISGATAGTK